MAKFTIGGLVMIIVLTILYLIFRYYILPVVPGGDTLIKISDNWNYLKFLFIILLLIFVIAVSFIIGEKFDNYKKNKNRHRQITP